MSFFRFFKHENYGKLYLILIFLAITSFIFGFIYRENAAGGGQIDLAYEWKNHLLLKQNLLNFIYYPHIYDGARIPLYQILSIFFNPYTDNIISYLNYFFLYSFLIPILFFFCINKNYIKINIKYKILLCSVIFLSPYFRTSSFWGLQENLAYVFMLISYLIHKNNLSFKENKIRIFLLSFSSCAAFYSDQKFIFLPVYFFLDLIKFFPIKNFKLGIYKIYILILFLIFSLPSVYIFWHWGSVVPPELHKRLNSINYFNLVNFFQVFSFYLLPFLITNENFLNEIKNFIIKKRLVIIIYSFFFLFFFIFFDTTFLTGGGWLHKIYLYFNPNKFFLLFYYILSIISFIIFYYFLKFINNDKKNYVIIFFLILIALFSNPFFQEYFDPLIFILITLFFNRNNFLRFDLLKISFYYFFYTLLLVFSILYYSF